jgi:ATP-dependent Lon protease
MPDKMLAVPEKGGVSGCFTQAQKVLSTLEFETLVIKVGVAFCLGKIFTINFSKTEQHKKIFAALEKMYDENIICVGLLNDDRLNFSPSNIGLYAIMVGLDRDRRCCSFVGKSRFEVLDISELFFQSNQYAYAKIRLLEDRKIGDQERKEFNYLRNAIDKIMATLFGWGNVSVLQQGHWNNHIFDKDMEPGKLADQIVSSSEMFSECRNQIFYQLDPCIRLRITTYRLESIVKRTIEGIKDIIAEARQAEFQNKLVGVTNQVDKKLAERFNKVKSFMYPEMAKIVEDRLASCNGMDATSKAHKENVEFILSMPWGKYASEIRDSLNVISAQLDKDHYGMPDAKKKILQYLAVKQLNPHGQNSVLCLMGPPGTGKTSFFQSLGRALDRPFVKFALGGVHDESDIRGHRMTYVGALAGRIIQLVRQSGVMNPIFVLDEIDKLGEFSAQGNPAAALLEVLDPEQNSKFIDNYIGGPIDLSQVLFVITGNDIRGINPILRDRLHIIKIEGYTLFEKFMIAKNYLIPRQLRNSGVENFVEFSNEAIQKIVDSYAHEEGVRGIDHCIYDICAECALRIVSSGIFNQIKIGISEVEKIMVNHKTTERSGREIGYGAK